MLYFCLQWLHFFMFLNLQGEDSWSQETPLMGKAGSMVGVFTPPQAMLSLVLIYPFLLEKTNLI